MAGGGDKKEKEGELGARSLRSLRRCVRLATIKEAAASERSEILRLKREAKLLMKRTPAEEEIRRIKREADALMNRASAEEEPQPEPVAGNKRRKTVIKKTLVPRAAIEFMILHPHKPLDSVREEKLAIYTEDVRKMYFRRKAIADNVLEQERALIKQFRKKGYAEDYAEVEVTDDEED